MTDTRLVALYYLDRTIYGNYYSILEAANFINCNEKKQLEEHCRHKKKLVKRQ